MSREISPRSFQAIQALTLTSLSLLPACNTDTSQGPAAQVKKNEIKRIFEISEFQSSHIGSLRDKILEAAARAPEACGLSLFLQSLSSMFGVDSPSGTELFFQSLSTKDREGIVSDLDMLATKFFALGRHLNLLAPRNIYFDGAGEGVKSQAACLREVQLALQYNQPNSLRAIFSQVGVNKF